MLGSLRWRLLATVGVVVGASIGAFAVYSSRVARTQFELFREVIQEGPGAAPVVPAEARELLLEHRRKTAGWDDVEPLLRHIAERQDDAIELYLATPDGRVRPTRAGVELTLRPGGELMLRQGADALGRATGRLEVIDAALELDDGAGGTARLYLVPRATSELAPPQEAFAHRLNRWLLGGVVVAGLLALLATAALSQRIVRPVERLTRAARRMQKGDLTQRVDVEAPGEVGELGRAFNAMADGLQRIEKLRRNLVGDVAHELRTPLTNLRAQLEAIQDGLVVADRAAIDSLHEEVLLLKRLVDDLQELAYAEAGRLRLERRAVSIHDEINGAVASARSGNGSGGPPIEIDLPPSLPPVHADPARLRQVLLNLLRNAIVHTPADGRVIVEADADEVEVRIRVRDSGRGIDAAHLPHVFDRFYRTDPSRDRSTGGAGLGLAIVRQLVEAHRGRVWAESRPGHGSCFHLTLPLAQG